MSKAAAHTEAPSRFTRSRALIPLVVVFGVALGIRLLYLADATDNPSFLAPIVDAGAYDMMARQLAATGEAVPRLFWQPFLYPVFLAVVYLLTGGSIVAAKIAQAGLGAITCCLVYVLAGRLLNHRSAVTAAAITAVYGPLILFEGELLAAGLAALWAVLLVLLFTAAADRPAPAHWIAVGMACALAVLTRPTFVPFVAAGWLWLAWHMWRAHGARRAAAGLVCGAVAFATVVAPVAAWNARVTGRFGFIPGSGGLNTYIGNNPQACDTLAVRPGAEWGDLIAMPARHGATTPGEENRFFYSRVWAFMHERPAAFLSGLGRKALQVVGSREIPRNLDVYLARRWSALLAVVCWKIGPFGFPFGLLLPLATVGLVFRWRQLGMPLLLFLGLYSAAIVLVFVTARYRVPLVPVLAVAAAAGIAAVAGMIRQRQHVRLTVAAGVAVVSITGATLPGPFCEEQLDLEADFYYCLGHSHNERGAVDAAIHSYQTALAANPDLEQVHYNLGRIFSHRRDLGAAERHYREAIRIDPGFARAHNNLGSVLRRAGRNAEAIDHFRDAAWNDPDLALAHRNLATALLENGQPEDALSALDTVQRLEPGNAHDHFLRGSARLQLGDPEGAVDELRQAIGGGADAALTRIELGTAFLALSRPAEALEQFELAIGLDPEAAQAHNNAGVALAMAGRLDEALPRFAEAVRLAPGYVDARFNLARALARSGDVHGAAEQLRVILEQQPEHAAARSLLERLR